MAPAALSSQAALHAGMGGKGICLNETLSREISRHHGTYAMAKGDFSTRPADCYLTPSISIAPRTEILHSFQMTGEQRGFRFRPCRVSGHNPWHRGPRPDGCHTPLCGNKGKRHPLPPLTWSPFPSSGGGKSHCHLSSTIYPLSITGSLHPGSRQRNSRNYLRIP